MYRQNLAMYRQRVCPCGDVSPEFGDVSPVGLPMRRCIAELAMYRQFEISGNRT